MTFDDPSTALAWVSERWDDFLGLDSRMLNLQHAAADIAATTSDPSTARLAREAVERLADLREWHDRALRMFGTLRDQIPSLGTLRGPWVWGVAAAGTALALGSLVAWIYARYGAEAEIVRALQAGAITAAEARDLIDATGNPPGILDTARWILAGIVGLAAWRWWNTRES